ncbi:MAG: apolipoprotein N-acyltransferase [Gammaproteobacteria bacterium]|nr:apolipoprotein N-acyltransferase [Gammaproteobacteria bacterium]
MQTLLAGALAVFGFAPFGMFPLSVVALVVLFRVWHRCESAAQAARAGFTFGMGLFSFGVGWVYVALHDYGYMHPLLAITATLLFAALISSPLALAGYALMRFRTSERVRLLLLMPALWVLAEWLRGLMFTGFPWLAFGYAQVPDSPLLGYAPVLGVYGVSLAVSVSAGLLLFVSQVRWSAAGKSALGGLGALWLLGAALQQVAWTQPNGDPLKVSLLQGNIQQDEKFSQEKLVATLETYRRLAQGSDARLIVLPETAFPLLRHNVPPYYQQILRDHVRQNGGDILIGAFEKEGGSYFNSVYSLGSAESQHYRKDHLVPFGEFIPLRGVLGWFINEVLQIPMGDLSSGGDMQAPLAVAGQQVAVNICYEDVFGEEIIRALPQATLLVNVTNDAWYGESNAAVQHNQMSQMRARETGRMMLRATNTGVTSVIGTDGQVLAQLLQHEEGVLTAQVQGYTGSTPYVRWGNVAVLILLASMLGAAARYSRL